VALEELISSLCPGIRMTNLLGHLADLLALWKAAFSDSKAISTAVTSTHILALLFGGGFAVSADWSTLRLGGSGGDDRARLLASIRATHPVVLTAIGVLSLSGLALAAADVDTFAVSVIFWVKMVAFGLLLLNGAVLKASADALGREGGDGVAREMKLARRLRTSALCSLALWSLTLVLGTALTSYA
jgi:hypothetical protein